MFVFLSVCMKVWNGLFVFFVVFWKSLVFDCVVLFNVFDMLLGIRFVIVEFIVVNFFMNGLIMN